MLNCEKYREEIEKADYLFGIVGGHVVVCTPTACRQCALQESIRGCFGLRAKWLMSEYVEKPKISQRQHDLCKVLKEYEYRYLAREESGYLHAHRGKPRKNVSAKHWVGVNYSSITAFDIAEMFSFIDWEDDEPWAIDDILELEVE